MLCPPFYKCFVVGSSVPYFPIYLWDTVVYPSFVYPVYYVSVKVVVALQAFRVAAFRTACYVAVDSEGRNSEFYPGFCFAYSLVHLPNEAVYIVASPVAFVGNAAIVATDLSELSYVT